MKEYSLALPIEELNHIIDYPTFNC